MEKANVQQQVCDMLTKEHLTIKQIAQRRETSVQAVYKTVRKLIKKGILNKTKNKPHHTGGGGQTTHPFINEREDVLRLHGGQFRLGIIECSKRYEFLLRENNVRVVDGQLVKLHGDCVEVYPKSFFYTKGDARAAHAEYLRFFLDFFVRLEAELGFTCMKAKRSMVREVKTPQVAWENNELAVNSRANDERIKVRGKDGKVWLQSDRSFKLDELEMVHPQKSIGDTEEVVKPFMNLLRQDPEVLNKLITLQSNQVQLSNELFANVKVLSDGLRIVVGLLTPSNGSQAGEPSVADGKPEYVG